MRPKNQKGKRWFHFVQSPKYLASIAWRHWQKNIREFLHDPPLPHGLASEQYLLTRVERLKRFDDLLETELRLKQDLLKQQDHAALENTGEVAVLPVTTEILVASSRVWETLLHELKGEPTKLRSISHREFEEFIAFIFKRFGYEVELTAQTRDGGRDIIAVKRAEIHTKYLIECKHPRTAVKIGISPVRELYAVKVDEKATKAILATTSYLTKDAQLFLERHKWELEARDFDGVMDWVKACRDDKSQPVFPNRG